MAGKIDHIHKQAFKDFVTVCQIRGKDSTGVMKVDMQGKFHFLKRACLPHDLVELKQYDNQIENGMCKVMIGHTRSKTYGAVNSRNAHPFEHGDVCGVHNGTLKGAHNMEGWKDFDVDSDWLYYHINRFGLEETITKLDQDGAWALNWWNENDKTLNFLRNKERPLWFTHSKDMKTLFWASEIWMFGTISRRIELWDGGEDKNVFYPLSTDEHYAFEINGHGSTQQEIFKMRAPVALKGEVRGYAGNSTVNRGGSGVNRGTGVVDFRQRTAAHGGQVTGPFRRNDLNDDIVDLGTTLALPNHSQGRIPTADGLKNTVTFIDCSSKSLPTLGDGLTGPASGTHTEKRKLSLPSTTFNSQQQESNESTPNISSDCTVSLPSKLNSRLKGHVSLRKIAGIEYITDNKTSREFSVHAFEQETGCKCGFCQQPIGDLNEVSEIFVRPQYGKFAKNTISFVCKPCTTPYYNS